MLGDAELHVLAEDLVRLSLVVLGALAKGLPEVALEVAHVGACVLFLDDVPVRQLVHVQLAFGALDDQSLLLLGELLVNAQHEAAALVLVHV